MDINDAVKIAAEIKVPTAVVIAICKVESPKGPLLPSGRPTALLEAAQFWKRVKSAGLDPALLVKTHPGILAPDWARAKKLYRGGEAEWSRIQEAAAIHEDAAYQSASFGQYQIMGFNSKVCGYKSAKAMADAFTDPKAQDKAFIAYCAADPVLISAMRKLDWHGFAKRYNGPGYAQNNYHVKMANEHKAALALLKKEGL
jgi:hypothetical protein